MAKQFKRKFKKRIGHRRMNKGVSNVLSVYKFKVAAIVNIVNSTAGALTQAVNLPINYPGQLVTNSGAWTTFGTQTPQLLRLMTMFNEYRVKRLKVNFYPAFVDTGAATNTSIVSNLIYRFDDETDVSDLVTEGAALGSGIPPKCYSNGKTCNYTMRQFKPNRGRWFYTQNYQQIPSATPTEGYVTIQNSYASMKLFFQGISADTTAGALRVEWDCEFRGQIYD